MAKAQQDVTISPRLITAIDRTWAAIQKRHPDVPDVVITLGAGSGGKAGLKLGHFAAERWQQAGVRLPELFIGERGWPRAHARSSAPCCTRARMGSPAPGRSRTRAGRAASTTPGIAR